MGEVDRARVRQPADHLLRDIGLDLAGLELPDEPPQELARLVAGDAFDFDRREQIAILLGDREVHADVAGDELLQLFAHRRHQGRVRPEMLRARQHVVAGGGAQLRFAFLALVSHDGFAQRRRARRQVDARKQPVHLVHDPAFKCHVSSPVGDHHRRQWSRYFHVSHARARGQAVALRQAFDELSPRGLDRFSRVDALL